MRDLTFYSCAGGDLIAYGIGWLEAADAEALAGLHQDEILAAQNVGDLAALDRARRLADQLAVAQTSSAGWRRAARGLNKAGRPHDRAR